MKKAQTKASSKAAISLDAFKFSPTTPPRARRNKCEVVIEEQATVQVALASVTHRTPTSKRTRNVQPRSETQPRKKRRRTRGYASPETYEHLHHLQDCLDHGLDIVYCGINPDVISAEVGHRFVSPTNHFWRCLYESGLTDRKLSPTEDFTLPESYSMGLTCLVDRPTAEQAELSKTEMISGVPTLSSKIAKYKPRIVCFLGKGIWQVFVKEASRLSSAAEPAFQRNDTTLLRQSKYFTPTPCRPSTPSSTPPTSSPYFSSPLRTPSTPVDSSLRSEGESDVLPQLDDVSRREVSATPKSRTRHRDVFDWGLQPVKMPHADPCDGIKESLFFVVPSTSARVHWDKTKLFVSLREKLLDVKAGRVKTASMSVIRPTDSNVPQSSVK
ncbi:hypothetical protein EIP91_008525 [Steccherinum ochraceum]|uniref:Uracil-DNA glycosylase-like domain-containing protein n=1 Tax=Steccherinum ochraceum TaxID=92696 RepID=A0A4R0RCR5_9APHY|nr:hypothetical protein EIP91_008525 [Steccherinum ochraceum]